MLFTKKVATKISEPTLKYPSIIAFFYCMLKLTNRRIWHNQLQQSYPIYQTKLTLRSLCKPAWLNPNQYLQAWVPGPKSSLIFSLGLLLISCQDMIKNVVLWQPREDIVELHDQGLSKKYPQSNIHWINAICNVSFDSLISLAKIANGLMDNQQRSADKSLCKIFVVIKIYINLFSCFSCHKTNSDSTSTSMSH